MYFKLSYIYIPLAVYESGKIYSSMIIRILLPWHIFKP